MFDALRLYQFRNYGNISFSFAPGVNGIFGPNGSGKTNILEAISLLSTGRSFRGASLEEMTFYDHPQFLVEGRIMKNDLPTKISLIADKTKKCATINGNQYSYFSAVLGSFPTVLFAPRDMNIITAAPADRRRFWNILLAQGSPFYLLHLTRYTRAIKQRNVLLKKKDRTALNLWDTQLAFSGLQLIEMRRRCIESLQPILQKHHTLLSPESHEITITYEPSINVKTQDEYIAALKKNLEKDLLYQTTNTGPHRDDFSIKLDHRLAKTYASEGQKRTCIAALKCSEWDLLNEQADTPPVFCIDDCPAHLDEIRTERFISTLTQFPQVILSAPSKKTFPLSLFTKILETSSLLPTSS